MGMFKNKLKTLIKRYVSLASLVLLSLAFSSSYGQGLKITTQNKPTPRSCDCSPFYKNASFKNPKLISGSALCAGAVYRFANVFPNNQYGTTIDALVKVVAFNGGASLLEMDVTSTGIPEAFQPRINSTNKYDQSVLFNITFVTGGGNYGDEVVISFYASPYDIDGDSVATREYAEVSLPDAYFLSNKTLIDITQTVTLIRGEAINTSTAPKGDISVDSRYTYSNYFENKSSFTYKIGKKDGNSDRYYSLNMSCANYTDPNSVLITYPVICGSVKDINGSPLSNVKVDITGSDGSLQNLTTDSSGNYKAVARIPEALVDVVYKIKETDLNGYISVSDTDGANDNLITKTINLASTCSNNFVDGVKPKITVEKKTDLLCHGASTGTIKVSATGGVPPYNYSINGNTPQSSSLFEGLSAGNYTIKLIDSLGNTATTSVTLSEPEALKVTIAKEIATSSNDCKNGKATATVSGGTSPYTYLWSASAGNQTTNIATNLPSGTHSVTIKDANNCVIVQDVVIGCSNTCDAKIKVNNVTNVLCAGETSGSATVSASSVANPSAKFTFTWNTTPVKVDSGVTTSSVSGLKAGIYTVSVTIDGAVCDPVEHCITIVEPKNVLNATATATDESGPSTADGTATVTATGGTPPYTYLWSPGGQTTQKITGLSAGNYTVTVTDANHCSVVVSTKVNPGTCDNLSANVTTTAATCNGESNGSAKANVSGGSGSFTYLWSPGGGTTQSISGLSAGTYTVSITDTVTKCTVQASCKVNEPNAVSSGITVSNALCFGENTGSLDLTITGGTSPYSFLWSNGATTEDLNNLNAGTYTVSITDAKGCQTSNTATVRQPESKLDISVLSQTDINCNNSIGSVKLNAFGGTSPYSYNLDGVVQSSGEFTNLEAGDYTIKVVDAYGCENSITVTILKNCTDAQNDINNTVVNTPVTGNVLTNDTDSEGDTQRVTTTTVTTAQGVVVAIDPTTGVYTYTPPVDYVGEDSFEYSVCDDSTPEACDTAMVYIEVLPIGGPENEAPIANADTAGTKINTPVTGNVLSNDFDPDGDTIVVTTTTVTTSEGVVVTIDPNTGEFTYTPPAGFTGDDSFVYTICDTGNPALCDTAVVVITVVDNQGNITIANDDAYTTIPGVLVSGNVLENDSDPEGDTQTVSTTPVKGVENGLLVLNTDGTFTYTPNTGFTGTDSFVYSVCDNGTPQACDQATVYITVIKPAPANSTNAENDINNTVVNTPVTGNVLTNDTDPEGDTQRVTTTTVTTAQGVVVTIDPTTGVYTYTPPVDYVGEDSFEYTVCDDGTPEACDTAMVYIEVLPIGGPENEAPIANADTAGTKINTPVTGNVLSNDFDPDGDTIVVTTTTVTTSEGVVVTIDPNTGEFTYTPPAGFTGDDSFVYTICDTGNPALCDTAVVVITVVDNQANITLANDDAFYNNTCDSILGNVLENDSDPEGDTQTVTTTPVKGVENGLLVLNTDGTFTYTPNAGFTGTDSFVYSVCDNGTPRACDQATVYITIVDAEPPYIVSCNIDDKTIVCSGLDNKSVAETWNAENIAALEICAEDICDTNLSGQVTSDFDFNNFESSCGLSGSIDVTYTITDDSGNATTLSVTLTIIDTTPPDISDCTLEDKVLSCSLNSAKEMADQWNSSNIATLEACAKDDCSVDQAVTVTSNYNFDNLNAGKLEVIYTVTDDCGNSSTTSVELTLQNDAVSSTDISLCVDSEVESQVFNLFNLLSGNYNTGGTWAVVSGDASILDGHYFNPKSVSLSGENDSETITFSYTEKDSSCPTYIEASIEVNNVCAVKGCDLDNIVISVLLTPNGDSHNEYFTVSGIEDCDFKIDVKIVNRWGAIIFQSNNYQNDWNAFIHKSSVGPAGQVPSGTYYYVVTLIDSGKAPITGLMYIGTK